MKGKLIGLAAVALGSAAGAAVGNWQEGYISGNSCTVDDVHAAVDESSDHLRLGFDALGVSMPSGERGDGLTVRKTCNLRLVLAVPEGYRLVGLTQAYRGQIEKSLGASARLQIRASAGSQTTRVGDHVFGADSEAALEDGSGLIDGGGDLVLDDSGCGGSVTYGLNITLLATRASYYQNLVGGLALGDSALEVQPVYEACADIVQSARRR